MLNPFHNVIVAAALVWTTAVGAALANGALDGRVFKGVIGPEGSADLADSLHFDDGHFWSDICTKCGFVPGAYSAEYTADGILFRGVLESDTRGRFTYEGRAKDDGTLTVAIAWEKRRWYWTSRRSIEFEGIQVTSPEIVSLEAIRAKLGGIDPSDTPLCARF